jgi:hypothetical protein
VFFWKTLIAPFLDPTTRIKMVLLEVGMYRHSPIHTDMRLYIHHDDNEDGVDIIKQR